MKILKTLSALAISATMVFSVAAINVSAATTTQDGLEVSLATDKEAYNRDENISVKITVTNNNSVAVENIAIENFVPDNYRISYDTVVHKMIPYLNAGETTELNTTFVYNNTNEEESSKEESGREESSKEESSKEESSKEESSKEESSREESSKEESSKEESSKEESSTDESTKEESSHEESSNPVIMDDRNNTIKTGDNGLNVIVAVLLALISTILIVVCVRKKKGKQLLSLVLCTSVAGTMVIYSGYIKSNAVEANDDYTVTLEAMASVDGNNVSISSSVKYDRIATVFPTQYDEMGNIDSQDPEIEIYDFKADTYDIPVGEEQEVTFTAEIFSDVLLSDNDVLVVNKYGELIGYMNDKGIDGDAEAEDGVYTLKLLLYSEKAYSAQYYVKVHNNISKCFSIGYFSDLLDSDITEADEIAEELFKSSSPYLDEQGDVDKNNVTNVMLLINKVLDGMKSDGMIKQFIIGETSVVITLNNDYSFVFSIHIKDTATNSNEVSISTYQPFKGEDIDTPFSQVNGLADKSTDGMAEAISNKLGFSFNGNYDNENVTLDVIKNIGNNKIIIWDGHGGYDTSGLYGVNIMSGELVNSVSNSKYKSDIGNPNYRILSTYTAKSFLNGNVFIMNKKNAYSVTAGFFDKYLSQNRVNMNGAFVYLGACDTGLDMMRGYNVNTKNYHLAQSFIDHGASAVVVTSGNIESSYNSKMRESIIQYMLTASTEINHSYYNTVQEAIDYAVQKNGKKDGCPFVVGDPDYSFDYLLGSSNNETNNYGTVSGKIIDSESGYGIQGALVRIYKDDRLVSKVRTDSHGNYTDDMLRPGNYVLKITDSYYHSAKIAVTVNANETTYNESTLMFKVVNNPVKKAYGIIKNAVNGMAVSGATIKVRQNWNNKNGEIITEVETNENGKYEIDLSEGFFTLEVIKDGYITAYGNIVIGSVGVSSQDISLSPVISDSTYRVVLTWNDNPSDLDSHLFGKVSGKYDYHIYYQNKSKSYGGETIANLDRDDTDGNGPETTVFDTLPNGEYDYYVDWYKGTGTWASSGGKIDIYNGNTLIKTLNVPNTDHQNGSWKVFSVKNGVFTVYNTIQNEDIYIS